MVISLMLVGVLAQAPVAQAQDQAGVTGPTIAAGVALADANRDDEALEVFQALTQRDPSNHEARLWVARMHERAGRLVAAEAVYMSVLLEDDANVDARLGVAEAQMQRLDPDRAIAVLEPAEALAPSNPVVLDALGRAHRMAGHEAISRDYLQRAADVEPIETRALAARDALQQDLSRFESHTFAEEFDDGRDNATVEDITVRLSVSERVRVIGLGQTGSRSGVRESRGGLGLEWRWTPATTLTVQAVAGPGNVLVPEGDYMVGVAHTYMDLEVSGFVRVFQFPGAHAQAISPALVWRPEQNLELGVRYSATLSDPRVGPRGTTHSATLHGDVRVAAPMWVGLAYSRGIEDFDRYTAEYLGDFEANTGRLRLRFDMLDEHLSVVGAYERQWRDSGTEMGRATVSLITRF